LIERAARPNAERILTRAVAIFLVSTLLVFEASRAEEKSPLPLLIIRKGLDVQNNKIDALIAQSGVACLPALMDRPCRIEKDLLVFVRSLPADQEAIAQNLQSLGAVCRLQDIRLNCKIERETETTGLTADPAFKPNTTIDRFLIEFIVTGRGAELQYEVNFDRTERPKDPQN
jgi:hypothetical protein